MPVVARFSLSYVSSDVFVGSFVCFLLGPPKIFEARNSRELDNEMLTQHNNDGVAIIIMLLHLAITQIPGGSFFVLIM